MAKRRKRKQPRVCDCGCGGMTKGGLFLPGHDAKLKRALKKRASLGDSLAIAGLQERGWAAGDRKHLILALETVLEMMERALTRFPPKNDEVRLMCDAVRAVLGKGERIGPSPVEATVRSGIEDGLIDGPSVAVVGELGRVVPLIEDVEVRVVEQRQKTATVPLAEETHAALDELSGIVIPSGVGQLVPEDVLAEMVEEALELELKRPDPVEVELGPLLDLDGVPGETEESYGKSPLVAEIPPEGSGRQRVYHITPDGEAFETDGPAVEPVVGGSVEPIFFNRKGAYPDLDPEHTDLDGLFDFDGFTWWSVWHAYEASKTDDMEMKEIIRSCKTVGWVKRKTASLIPHGTWGGPAEEMLCVIEARFAGSPSVLVEAGDAPLHWESPDGLWGYASGKGADMYGKLLMRVREGIGELAF